MTVAEDFSKIPWQLSLTGVYQGQCLTSLDVRNLRLGRAAGPEHVIENYNERYRVKSCVMRRPSPRPRMML